jgi:hypothetical protein
MLEQGNREMAGLNELTRKERLERLQQLCAGGAHAVRLLQLELGRQHHAQAAAGVAEDVAAQPAMVPQPRQRPGAGHKILRRHQR